MKTIYECSHSKSVKWITTAFVLAVVAAIGLEAWRIATIDDRLTSLIVIIVLLLALLSIFYLYPQYIISDDEGIGIHTLLRTVRVPYSNIDHIERMDENFLKTTNSIRLFGIGGALGYIGLFRTKGKGNYIAYITDPKKVFFIYRKHGMPIAFSVSEPDEFMPYYLKSSNE